jgi:hypothetical protein
MTHGALPLSLQILLDFFFPPAGSANFWLLSRGWLNVVQGGQPSERSLVWLRRSCWILLIGAYCLVFGIIGQVHSFG